MPGVTISTAVRTGPSNTTVRDSSQAFFVGLAERGPTEEAVKVNSLAEFEEIFGGYVSYAYLHPTVQAFFEEGGTQAYIARVVGPDATTGTLDLMNSTTDVITLNAVGAGAWSANLTAEVVASSALRNIRIRYNGDIIFTTGLKATNTELVSAINTSTFLSNYLTATLVAATPLVAAVSATALSTGDDDRTEDTVDTTPFAAYTNALDYFLDSFGPGAVSCPEINGINAGLIAHANTNNRIAILHGAFDEDDMATVAADLAGEDGAEHAAIYHPWVYTPTSVSGVNRLIPPDGYVMGKRALAHNQNGPHQPYAGLISGARFVNGVYTDVNKTTGDELDENFVNAIRIIANQVRIYGARSLSTDTENFRFITSQDVINSVVSAVGASMEDLIFTVIDGRGGLFAEIEGRIIAICENMKSLGALYEGFNANGKKVDPGYTVKCDPSINTIASLAQGTVAAQVGVRVSSIGDKINVTIVKSNLTSTVTV
jgi:phage tail sheath protein FI